MHFRENSELLRGKGQSIAGGGRPPCEPLFKSDRPESPAISTRALGTHVSEKIRSRRFQAAVIPSGTLHTRLTQGREVREMQVGGLLAGEKVLGSDRSR